MPKLTFSQDNHSAEYSLKNAKYQDKSDDIRKMKEMGMKSNFQISQDKRIQGSLTSNMINFNSSQRLGNNLAASPYRQNKFSTSISLGTGKVSNRFVSTNKDEYDENRTMKNHKENNSRYGYE